MNKHLLTILTVTAFAGMTIVSCKKGSSSTSTKDMITGTWTIARIADDTNNNGKADANEWFVPSGLGVTSVSLNLKSDGSFAERVIQPGSDTTENGNWTLSSNNAYLTLSLGGSSSLLHIDTLTAHLLVVKDTSSSTIEWTSLTK